MSFARVKNMKVKNYIESNRDNITRFFQRIRAAAPLFLVCFHDNCDTIFKCNAKRLSVALCEFMFAAREPYVLNIEFNDMLWQTTVECVIVYGDGRMV